MELVGFHLSLFCPSSEVAGLPIQSVTSKRLLAPDGVHLPISTQHAAIVLDILVPNARAEIDEHVFAYGVGDNFSKNLPAVQLRIILDVVVSM
jgi:hypothetical protein